MAKKQSKSATRSNSSKTSQDLDLVEGLLNMTSSKPISKSEAVRQALANGHEQPADGVKFILEQFGLEIGPQHFSAVKATEKKKQANSERKTSGGWFRSEPSKETRGYLAPPVQKPLGEDDELLAALEAIKPLVDSLGADKVKRIADLLG